MRSIAAILVFAFHFYDLFLNSNQEPLSLWGLNFAPFFAAGHNGVVIFFVLSGFLLFLSFKSSQQKEQDFKSQVWRFYQKRFWRLFPLVAVFSLTVFVLIGDYSATGLKDLGYHLLFIQGFSLDTYHGLNPVMWTLTVDLLFILSLPFLLYFTGKSSKKLYFTLVFLTLLSLSYRAYIFTLSGSLTHFQETFYSEQFWGRFSNFALGIFLGSLYYRDKLKFGANKTRLFTLGGLLLFYFALAVFSNLESAFREIWFTQVFLLFGVALAVTLFLAGILASRNNSEFLSSKIRQVMAGSFFCGFAKISFGFFLWHFPVLSVLNKLQLSPIAGFFLGFILSLILAYGSYFLIERPSFNFAKTINFNASLKSK